MRYGAPYVHEKNRLAKQGWKTIFTIKESILIDNRLPNNFWTEAVKIANYLQNRLPTKSKNHGEMISENS